MTHKLNKCDARLLARSSAVAQPSRWHLLQRERCWRCLRRRMVRAGEQGRKSAMEVGVFLRHRVRPALFMQVVMFERIDELLLAVRVAFHVDLAHMAAHGVVRDEQFLGNALFRVSL